MENATWYFMQSRQPLSFTESFSDEVNKPPWTGGSSKVSITGDDRPYGKSFLFAEKILRFIAAVVKKKLPWRSAKNFCIMRATCRRSVSLSWTERRWGECLSTKNSAYSCKPSRLPPYSSRFSLSRRLRKPPWPGGYRVCISYERMPIGRQAF